jgi:hypothetical protein
MVVSLLQIIHTGLQDERLLPTKGKPKVSFFQKVFVKAGRFTTAWVRLDFDTRPNFATQASITLPRQGHLITRLYLVTTMPDIVGPQLAARAVAGSSFAGPTFGWTNSLGHALIQNATIDIGGARVEQLNGRLMEMLDEFNTPLEKVTSVNSLLPRIQDGFNVQSIGWSERPAVAVTPLPFWFSRGDPGVALPIDAINNDQVRLSITFAPLNSLYVSSAQVNYSTTQTPVGGEAYFPLLNSPFYQTGGTTSVKGLTGNPNVSTFVTPIQTLIKGKLTSITMEPSYTLGDTYVLAEYVYLDKPEANKFRIADFQYPLVQHYLFEPTDTRGLPKVNIPLRIPNPTRDLFFFAQRYEAPAYNAPFLSSRDLSGLGVTIAPWWPNAQGLDPVNLGYLSPAFSTRQSEPLESLQFVYENKLVRYSNLAPQLFRSLLPAITQKKTPWMNGYYYTLPFGMEHGIMPPSVAMGEANLDKVEKIELRLQLKPYLGSMNPNNVPRYIVYCFAETYNILRVYGGRAGLLFAF